MTIKYDEIASELTKLTGKTFVWRQDSGYATHIDCQEAHLEVSFHEDYRGKRVEISVWVHLQGVNTNLNSFVPRVNGYDPDNKITVAKDRPSLAIAKDINRRLLTDWYDRAEKAVSTFLDWKATRDAQYALCMELADLCGSKPEVHQEYAGAARYADRFHPQGKIYKVYVGSDQRVNIEIHNLTREEALAIVTTHSLKLQMETMPLDKLADLIYNQHYSPSPERMEALRQDYYAKGGKEDLSDETNFQVARLYRKLLQEIEDAEVTRLAS